MEAEALVILQQLGCDEKMFNPAQPVRLPGHARVEHRTMQALLFLNSTNYGCTR